jgi:plasmid stabilization system protein ParE
MKSTIRPAAREDILRQYRYYLIEQNVEEIAQRFLEAVESAIHQVHSHPRIGSPRILPSPFLAFRPFASIIFSPRKSFASSGCCMANAIFTPCLKTNPQRTDPTPRHTPLVPARY